MGAAQLMLFLQETIHQNRTASILWRELEEFDWTPSPEICSYCGINGLLLITSLFDVSKSRCCMATTYRGDLPGPPPRDSEKWIRDRSPCKGSIQNKEAQHLYFAPLSGQTQYRERDSREEAPEIWQRNPPRPGSSQRAPNKAPCPHTQGSSGSRVQH